MRFAQSFKIALVIYLSVALLSGTPALAQRRANDASSPSVAARLVMARDRAIERRINALSRA